MKKFILLIGVFFITGCNLYVSDKVSILMFNEDANGNEITNDTVNFILVKRDDTNSFNNITYISGVIENRIGEQNITNITEAQYIEDINNTNSVKNLNLDDYNRIPTTDLRLIRRMVRDYNFRGYSAKHTIMNWDSVRRGEKKNIFPYQEEADIIFNSACVYELAVLKKYAKPLLEEIKSDDEAYIEANRLLKFLQYFIELEDTSDIPSTSILREFIGGSKIVD